VNEKDKKTLTNQKLAHKLFLLIKWYLTGQLSCLWPAKSCCWKSSTCST